ncbi:MAG: hypothetical protein V1711_01870 [bacterium]
MINEGPKNKRESTLSQEEIDALLSGLSDEDPKETPSAKVEQSPEVEQKQEELKPEDPWSILGSEKFAFQDDLWNLYNASSGLDLPDDVFQKYWSLSHEQEKNFESGDVTAQKETQAKIDAFMAEQRAAAEERKKKETKSKVEPPQEPEQQQDQQEAVRTDEGENDNQQIEKGFEGNYIDFVPVSEMEARMKEDTPAGWKKRLHDLIEGAGEKIGEVKEKVTGLFKQKKEYLTARSAKLGAELGNYDPTVEKLFRSMGDKYNKLGWKSKLGVGLGLGLGAAAFTTVSMPAAIACMSGIAAQRTFGMASMFLKFEKNNKNPDQSEEEKFWKFGNKEKAMLKAIGYSLGMSYGIGKAIGFASDSEYGQAVHEWLKHHWPFGSAAQPLSYEAHNAPPVPVAPTIPEIPTIEIPAIEIPDVSVNASPGHGYEWMMKRLWEQLRDKNLDPSKYADDSDIRQLLEAKADTIDGVVHRIALDENHGFFKPDGTSVKIDLDTEMFLNDYGDVQLSGHINAVHAPDGAAVTPVYPPPEAPTVLEAPATFTPETPVIPKVKVGAPPAPDVQAYSYIELPLPENPTTSISHPDDLPISQAEIQYNAVPDKVETPTPSVESETEPSTVESSPPVFPEVVKENIIINRSGIEVPMNESRIYADAGDKHLFVYGGSPKEQAAAIQEYLTANPDKVVYSAGKNEDGTYRILWRLIEGKAMPDAAPVQKQGFFGWLGSLFSGNSFMEAPDPEEFKSVIK